MDEDAARGVSVSEEGATAAQATASSIGAGPGAPRGAPLTKRMPTRAEFAYLCRIFPECPGCGEPFRAEVPPQVDHIIPFGSDLIPLEMQNELMNMELLCASCHAVKTGLERSKPEKTRMFLWIILDKYRRLAEEVRGVMGIRCS